jgi:hypothetical protein
VTLPRLWDVQGKVTIETLRETTSLSHCPLFPKERCLLEGSQASLACPFSRCGIKLKISVDHRCNDIDRENRWNDIDRENRSTGSETCHSNTLSTANRTWTDVELNQGLFVERPAIKDSH